MKSLIQAQYAIVFGVIAVMALFLFSCGSMPAYADPAPVSSNQPRPDIFASGVAAHPYLDYYSALDDKVEQQGVVLWAFDVQSGCSSTGLGGSSGSLALMMSDLYTNTGTASIYVDAKQTKPDLTIKIRCGATAAAEGVSGGVVGCLCYGFPYTNDIAINDVITQYPTITQVSIFCHEYCGHALSVWDEQYCKAYGVPAGCSGLFASVPGWSDIMNTGPDSRHYWGPTEIARWGRTHGSGVPQSFGKGDGYVWMCGIPNKALNVALYGWNGVTYRYIGSVPVKSLSVSSAGCTGLQTSGYVLSNEQPCVDLWNQVDTNHVEYRNDRCI